MADHFQVMKFVRIILLSTEKPLSYREIQKELKKFNIKASEPDILKALIEMPDEDRELIQQSLDEVQVTETIRSSHYKAGRMLKRKTDAKNLILNEIIGVDEKHISIIEEKLSINGIKVSLQSLLNEMEEEGLIRFRTNDHHFISITSLGKDYFDIFQ